MSLNFEAPSALEHFRCLVREDLDLPLLEAAASLALDAEPALDLQDVLFQVDSLAARLRSALPQGASALQRTVVLNEFFYDKLGFGVNANDFADPANSFVHRVLATRKGIPISLAVLWLELAAAIGLKAQGISFPGHFLIKVHVDEGLIIQDPLTGRGLTQDALQERLEPFREGWGLAQDEMAPLHLFLVPASGREILERMLRNLQTIYAQAEEAPQLLAVLHRLIVLRPQEYSHYRDRGLVLAQLGQRDAALQDLQTYVRHAPAPHDLPLIEARIELLRAEP
ncbi:tetratricopeptide repeat protein [Comamonas aquatica]|jgi:regulator of sirC expression with transglutaminase-like and TPR domain|uniref:Tetratricopeptide repeat protein n=1 Tax=Comamonas aquatica TaxID=225991 RepID=A0AA42W3X0_9BURK|nr:tetratricopeptide repeat protein [Comamonas aquatica]MDH1429428.1 tetratricopeptide repeat protein [Comamonas aquatica]MDH1606651.1 tetratricopeptide repeat protein [Comamonas aquatica]MDH1618366.1 tetratricopeptide repeat protein [Comamonas aquatica]MDH2006063.1 tetratricopeptide repeat protein [Comamonas aquatica]CAB5683771.1 Uncharacterised protein [Comamonas aquatica]